jgi:hypothetical protein
MLAAIGETIIVTTQTAPTSPWLSSAMERKGPQTVADAAVAPFGWPRLAVHARCNTIKGEG